MSIKAQDERFVFVDGLINFFFDSSRGKHGAFFFWYTRAHPRERVSFLTPYTQKRTRVPKKAVNFHFLQNKKQTNVQKLFQIRFSRERTKITYVDDVCLCSFFLFSLSISLCFLLV